MTKKSTIADTSVRVPTRVTAGHGIVDTASYLPPVHAPNRAGSYQIPATVTTARGLGTRAAKLRAERDMTVAELARRAGVAAADIGAFERDGEASVDTMIAVHRALSGDSAIDELFATPRFETIEDVVAYETRRRRT